eukprot:184082_1
MTEKENVATYARIRPYNPAINEDKRLTARCVSGCKILNQNGGNEDTYNFTKVYDMVESTNDLFETGMKPLLDYKILQGINSIFIVYGQSGSGKSFTLIGEDGHLGVLPMALQYLLKQEQVQHVFVSSIEAYGIKATKIGFYDLVHQLKCKKENPATFDAYSSKDNSRVNSSNAERIEITHKNALNIITELQEVSHMAPTLKNPHSSRGHTVYFCQVKMTGLEDVYFIAVDLAGSEGQTALGTKDEFVGGLKLAMSKGKLKLNKKQKQSFEIMYKTRSLEAGCINNGLTQLQTIFGELIKKRISKAQGLGLRKVLSSFISLKSAYAILFTLSASANNNKVTRATLNFAKQTQLVKVDTQKAKAKIDKDAIIKELNELIEELKKELSEKNAKIKDLAVTSEAMDEEKEREAFMNSRIMSLRDEIREAEEEEAKWTIDPTMNIQNMSEEEMQSVFDQFDEDGGGSIDCDELQNALKLMGQELSKEEVDQLFKQIDTNGDGEIDYEEFKVMVAQTWFIDAFQRKLLKSCEQHMARLTFVELPDLDDEDDDVEESKEKEAMNELQNKSNEELVDAIKGKMETIEELQSEIDQLRSQNEMEREPFKAEGDVMEDLSQNKDIINASSACGCLLSCFNKFNNKKACKTEPVLYHRFG